MKYDKLNLKNGDVIDEDVFKHIDNTFNHLGNAESFEDYSIHISFDDVVQCITNLTKNTYTSIFDEPFFGWLKSLHDTYNAKFSLYIYDLNKLASVPTTYKQELFEASDWLKFGLHSKQSGYNYASTSASDAKTDWNKLVSNVIRITGTHKSIDRISRLHNFSGNLEALTGMRDANCGVLGFLAADDSRVSYYLSEEQDAILKSKSTYLDKNNGLIFFRTNYRGEWLNSADGMYEKMMTFLSDNLYVNCFKPFVWFTHEPYVYKSDGLTDYKKNVEDVCRFAHENNIAFTYPQNKMGIMPHWFAN